MADKIEVDAQPIATEGERLLEAGHTLVRIENNTQMAMAIQRPRDEARILKALTTELSMYPEAADEAIYKKPVGGGKFATGLSVRAAEAMAYRWGNNGFGAEIISDDGEVVTGHATWVDFETNNRRTIPFRVSRKFKRKDNTMGRHTEDRFHETVVPAKQSKALREVILRSLPPGLKKEYERKAEEVRSKQGKDQRWAKMLRTFGPLGVSQADLEKMIGKEAKAFAPDDFDDLLGVYNAIMDGETTVAEAFGREVAQGASEGPKTVNVNDLLGKGGEFQEGVKPGSQEPPEETPEEKPLSDPEKREALWSLVEKLAWGDPEKADRVFDEIVSRVGSKAKTLEKLHGRNLASAVIEAELAVKQMNEEAQNG